MTDPEQTAAPPAAMPETAVTIEAVRVLDLVTDEVVRETFVLEGGGLKGARWTLKPWGDEAFQRERKKIRDEASGLSGVLDKLAMLDLSPKQIIDRALGDASPLIAIATAGGRVSPAAVELAEMQLEQRVAMEKKAAAVLAPGNGHSNVEDIQELHRQAKALVAEHLVVRVEGVPARQHRCGEGHTWTDEVRHCPTCGDAEAADPETIELTLRGSAASAIFEHPGVGDRIHSLVVAACKRREEELQAVLGEQAKNSERSSPSSEDRTSPSLQTESK